MSNADLEVLHERCVASLMSCTSNIVEHLNNETKKKQIKTMEKLLQEYCIFDYRNQVFESVKEQIITVAKDDIRTANDNGLSIFKKGIDSKIAIINKGQAHPSLIAFRDKIDVNNDEDDLNSSDLITTECTENYIDPFSKRQIEIPVRNKICGHIYEESSVLELIKMNSRLRCPVMGCGNRNIITKSDFAIDQVVLSKLTRSQTK